MAAQRKYTAGQLAKAIGRYFGSITRRVPRMERVETGELDGYGHPAMESRQVVDGNGELVWDIEWLRPPSVAGLCEYLDISRNTWASYCREPAMQDTTTRARGRIDAWQMEQLLSRPGKDVRGIEFALTVKAQREAMQQSERPSPDAESYDAQPMTYAAKIALLQELLDETGGPTIDG